MPASTAISNISATHGQCVNRKLQSLNASNGLFLNSQYPAASPEASPIAAISAVQTKHMFLLSYLTSVMSNHMSASKAK